MTRRLLILAVFLLAAAVVNVAVAWGCYSRADPDQQATLILDREMALWKKYADRGWPPEPTQATYGRAFGFEITTTAEYYTEASQDVADAVELWSWSWPRGAPTPSMGLP